MKNISNITNYIKIYDLDINDNLLDRLSGIVPYMDSAMTASGDTEYRRCKNIWLNKDIVDNIPLPEFFKDTYDDLDRHVNQLILNYTEDFSYCGESILGKHQGIHILKYDVNDYYNVHVDDFGESAFRRLSISIQLNDGFDGGDFVFFNNYRVTLRKNQGIIFPSSWIFTHQITPVISGERISAVTWVI